MLVAKDPARANIIARLKGNGSKRPLLIMGHSDTVRVDPAKWTFPPFSATRNGGYVYGRGTLDDKSDLMAAMMTMLLLKRSNVTLDRDVIFVSEVGEEAATGPGIEYLVNEHWNDIDAEICLAETGGVKRKNGQARYALVETTEKQPKGARLVAKGPAGHGSRPLQIERHRASGRGGGEDRGMGSADALQRHHPLLLRKAGHRQQPGGCGAVQGTVRLRRKRRRLASIWPSTIPISYSMLHTSISPNIIQGGYQVNVIPSEAEATLDIRALPDENIAAFLRHDAQGDQRSGRRTGARDTRNQRPGAAPSRLDSDAYHAIEAAYRKIYGVPTLPLMSTGATDMAFLRAKGVQCYGVGAMVDEEDAPKGFGPHSDQERILEEAVYKHVQFFWDAVTAMAASKN